MPVAGPAERLQKVLAQLGLGSRREAESWIRAGRVTVNGKPAVLGTRVGASDQLKLDGRVIHRQGPANSPVFLCHRSPGELLLPARAGRAAETASIAERLPRRSGRRFVSVSPMPTVDGGLELLTADGALAAKLQRAVGRLEVEYSVRIRGELTSAQQQAILEGMLDRGSAIRVLALEPSGGEASNRWYRLLVVGASGNEIRQLVERQAVTLVRVLRTRLGSLALPRTLARSHWRELTDEELLGLVGNPGSGR